MHTERCIDPTEIQEGELVAYLHGDASSGIAGHITRCAYCAEQVEQMRVVDAQLLAAFYRDNCPEAQALADLALNRLPAIEKLRVSAHVRTCPACQEEIQIVRPLTVDSTPPSLLERLREALALALVAQPVTVAPAPVRGLGWQGRFEVDDLVITLSFQEHRLTGRLRARSAAPGADYSGQAWLFDLEEISDAPPQSLIDEKGYFEFADVATGPYDILIHSQGQYVTLKTVQAP